MRLLLDTHAFLWYITDDSRLPASSADLIRQKGNDVFLIIVTVDRQFASYPVRILGV